MRRNIFIIIAILMVGGVATGIYLWNKPHQNMQRATADLTLTAAELMAAFNTDENAANTKYLDKVVAVTGKVATATTTEGTTVVSLEANDDFGVVSCELDKLSKHKRTTFSQGEEVTLKGVCVGKTLDVVLVRCVLTE
jgi:DNA/RNA endonuclease YhcR with UshA esterase domain